jgi:hypothetical protein
MGMCSDIQRKLLLDIHGALDERDRAELKSHLTVCRDCRDERERLLVLHEKIKEVSKPPELSPASANAMVTAVHERLKGEPTGWLKKIFSKTHFPVVPIAAAACAAVVVGLLAYRLLIPQSGFTVPPRQQPHYTEQDLEVIRHLDLLRNMDAIEKLVHIVDENGKGNPAQGSEQDIHGTRHNHYRGPYA